MRCSDAEEILKTRCPEFYDALVMNHERKFPIPEDAFDKDHSSEQLYWEEQLKTKYPEAYPVYLDSTLNAFVYFVGVELEKTNPEVAAQLGNYRAIRAQFNKDPSEENALCMQHFYPQAGDILLAQMLCPVLSKSDPSSGDHKTHINNALSALDLVVQYDSEVYDNYVAFDPMLEIDVDAILNDFLARKLITEEDLDNRACAYDFDMQGEKENVASSRVTLV